MTPPDLRSEMRQSLSLLALTALTIVVVTLLGLLATSIGA